MIEAYGLAEKIFYRFVRLFAPRRYDEVPAGKSDQDLIREYDVFWRSRTLWVGLVWIVYSIVLGGLHHWFVAESSRLPTDLYYNSSVGGWFGAFFFASGGMMLFQASPWSIVLSSAEESRIDRLGFEAKHNVNARRVYALLGTVGVAVGVLIALGSNDYVAFDHEALRWGHHGGAESSMPLAEIAEVRWYRRKEALRGTVSGGALIILKDGSRYEPCSGMGRGLSPDRCRYLAMTAGVPANVDLDVMPRE